MKFKEIREKIEWQFILWLAKHLPDCKYMTEQFSQALDRPPTFRERATMRLHLYTCEACRRYLRQINVMHESLVKTVPPEKSTTLSKEARDRINAAVAAAASRRS